ncbi:dipeptidase [Sphingomonas sanguinis]|uniref:Dipeptidase n=1 Tax=Sphingomonas sanguinis TaxID=33051 RepID=A0ABU5LRE1_9SPHN|nr:dipeptidase [Sphingomonas sanguinis]MDZ7282515.1 dipeptidase [Sphingomonas sanguinis]QXT34577.1 dipeptidase [Sphingomonas sanguinis]
MLIALLLAQAADPAITRRVESILARAPIVDGHNDLPWELRDSELPPESPSLATGTAALPHPLQTDLPRLKRGGIGGQFWSVWIPADVTGPHAVEMTLEQIDRVHRLVAAHPERLAMARTAEDIRRLSHGGRIASLIGVEGGHQIDGRLSVLRQYKALGVAYLTLTHGHSLAWADSSTDTPIANGLSPFGRAVVAEMNRIGMIVDVAHVSDATMAAVLDASKAPVIASHSDARALADAPRNIPDALLRRIGAGGGVVMVNCYPAFLSSDWRAWDVKRTAYARSVGVPANVYGPRSPAPLTAWDAANPPPRVTAAMVADHIEHIARVAGHGAVGFGGDYDGINGTGPEGMTGVDGYPLVLAELVRRGWSDADLMRLTSGNILRVMERVEAVAKSLSATAPGDSIDPLAR